MKKVTISTEHVFEDSVSDKDCYASALEQHWQSHRDDDNIDIQYGYDPAQE